MKTHFRGKWSGLAMLIVYTGLLLLLSGCTLQQETPKTQYYTINYPPPDPASETIESAVIHVKRITASQPYNSTRIVYSENKYEFSNYVYHQWMTSPSDMVSSHLARDLRESGIVDAVLTEPGNGKITHVIEGNIEQFYEFDTSPRWKAVLGISLTLLGKRNESASAPEVLFQKSYESIQEMYKNNPLGLARAMSDAMETISMEFISDVKDHLE